MKKIARIAFPILFAICLFAALSVTTSAAGPAADSYYDLWVGSVAVNPENESDVLGDGTVSFDPDTRTLILNGATVENCVSENNYYLSVYSRSDDPTNVVIKGKTRLAHGIRLLGTVTVENAQLTFSDSAMTAICLSGSDTEIVIKNSTVRAYGSRLSGARSVPLLFASRISIEKSKLTISYAVDAFAVDTMIDATDTLTAVDSEISVKQAIPTAGAVLHARGAMSFTNCSLDLSTPMYALFTENGSISLNRTSVSIQKGFFVLRAAELKMEKSSIDAEVFHGGIYVASSKTEEVEGDENQVTVRPTEVLFKSCEISIRRLPYSQLEKMLGELWKQMSSDDKLEYGNDKQTFVTQYKDSFAETTAFSAGFSGFCTSVSILRSELDLRGFKLGYYATGTSTLYISEGSEVKLKGDRIAFVMLTNAQNAVTVSGKLRSSKNIYMTRIEGDLSVLGGVLYTYSGKKPSIDLTAPYDEATPQDLFTVLSGVSDSLYFYPKDRIRLWIGLGIGAALLLGGGVAAFLIFRRRHRGKAANTKKGAKGKRRK